jgi:DnaK suppressor protein
MPDPEMEQFREQLLRMKRELQAQEETGKEAARPVELDPASMGRLTRMDAIQSQQLAKEAARRRAQTLVKIETALRRLDEGEFGACLVCGEDIDPRRLAVDPTHTLCIACAEKRGA